MMISIRTNLAVVLVLLAGLTVPAKEIWKVGKYDDACMEFALAPDLGPIAYQHDGIAVIGLSSLKTSWPYVQPGPADTWGGSRRHASTILFAIDQIPEVGNGIMKLEILDLRPDCPPELEIEINGVVVQEELFAEQKTPGMGLYGDFTGTTPTTIIVNFPIQHLNAGLNQIRIKTVAGGWFVYDTVTLMVPDEIVLEKPSFSDLYGVWCQRCLQADSRKSIFNPPWLLPSQQWFLDELRKTAR